MTVRDVIVHLSKFPQDMEVWITWDESGEYWPANRPLGRIDHVIKTRRKHAWNAWWESRIKGKGKAVCVLEHACHGTKDDMIDEVTP